MKIKGVPLAKLENEIVPIIRGAKPEDAIIFEVQPVLNFDEFDKLCPTPEPPQVMKPGGVMVPDIEDVGYVQQVEIWATKRTDWMIITSLGATVSLEWEKVKLGDSETWHLWRSELKESLSMHEVNRLVVAVTAVSGLDETKIEEARKLFLAGQAPQYES